MNTRRLSPVSGPAYSVAVRLGASLPTGLIEKRVEWSELRSARVAGFGAARRLLVRTEGGKFRGFCGATPEPAQAFAQVAARASARTDPR